MLNAFAPAFRVVGIYFAFGFLYLCLFVALSLDGLNLAALHSFFAAFALNIIIAALLQLASVIFERAFIGSKSVFFSAFVQNIFIAAMIFGFYQSDYHLALIAGAGVILSVMYFVALFIYSFFRATSFAQIALLMGVIFLAAGLISAGVLLACINGLISADCLELALCAHKYFMLGFVFLISAGSISVLLPMFLLSHKVSLGALKASLVIYLIAIVAKAFELDNYFIVAAFICLLIYCAQVFYKRSRKKLDAYSLNLILAFISSLVFCAQLLMNEPNYALLIYGILLPFIIAHAYKILPFLIWYHFLAPLVGKQKVPLLADMIINKFAYLALGGSLIMAVLSAFNMPIYLAIKLVFCISVIINMLNAAKFIKGVA